MCVLQNYARRNKVAIDDVTFDFDFLDATKLGEEPPKPEVGAYVSGLYLEGARWDFTNNRLAESNPKVLFTAAPVIWLKPCRNDELRAAEGTYGQWTARDFAVFGFFFFFLPVCSCWRAVLHVRFSILC